MPFTRTFPIAFTESGDIVNPSLAYPPRGWIIPAWASGLATFLIPFFFYALAQIRIRSVWDLNSAVLGTIWAVLLATLFQLTLKLLVGGFRPYFLAVCQPDLNLAPIHNLTGLNGSGYRQLMYTTEVCTTVDKRLLRDAMTSFPSGHSASSFAGFGFFFLWLNAKLKVWADYRPAFWKLALTMIPLMLASINACVLTVDEAHHWYDILGGVVIGIGMAAAAYRTMYASVWDWRYNHLNLHGKEAFLYGHEGEVDYSGQTLTRKAEWGGRRQWLSDEGDPTRATTTGLTADQVASARQRAERERVTLTQFLQE